MGATTTAITAKADLLEGKSWLNGKQIVSITEVDDKQLRIQTKEAGAFKFTEVDDFNYFVDNLQPAPDHGQLMIVDGNGKDVLTRLMNGLLDDYDKLATDPSFVPQARERSNKVNTMMNVIKVQLQMQGLK